MKSIVTKITRFDKVDTYNNWSYLVEFKNGDRGYYSTKSQDQTKFIVNQEVDYEIQEKIGKNDKPWWKITVPGEATPFVKGAAGGRPVADPRASFIGYAASYSKDLVIGGKIEIANMNAFSDAIFKNMIKQFNEIK